MPPRPRMNTYRIEGDIAYLALRNRLGEMVAEALIDADDLPLLIAHGQSWSPSPRGYVYGRSGKSSFTLHRFLLNPPADMDVDHRNGNRLDNRRCNLRVVTRQTNARNLHRAHKTNRLGVRGVRREHDLFLATVKTGAPVRVAGKLKNNWRMSCKTLNIARITADLARTQCWGKDQTEDNFVESSQDTSYSAVAS
jgi:hypothetical protein